jgi:hypothetical protein
MHEKSRSVLIGKWLSVIALGVIVGGCVVRPEGPSGAVVVGPPAVAVGPPEIDIVGGDGYHHHGYYDDHHNWHGGWVDEHGGHHDDPHDWHDHH